jgi:hypothetical protein
MLPAAAASRIGLLIADPEGDSTPERSSSSRSVALFLFGIAALALHANAISGSISSPQTRLDGGVATTKRHDGHEDPRMEFTQKLGAAASAVALSIGGIARAQDAVQWRVEDGGNGHWYQCVVRDDPMSNAIARDVAASRGAQLASLCGSEFDFVMTSTGALQPERWQQSDSSQWIGPWIGLELTVEGWKWVDGSSCQFDRWDAGLSQPDTLSAPGEPFAFLYARSSNGPPTATTTESSTMDRSAQGCSRTSMEMESPIAVRPAHALCPPCSGRTPLAEMDTGTPESRHLNRSVGATLAPQQRQSGDILRPFLPRQRMIWSLHSRS